MWRSGRFSIAATLGVRPALDVLPRAFWARMSTAIDVRSWYGIVLAAGAAPSRIGMGVPASRFASVALRLGPLARTSDSSRIEVSAAPAFSLATIGSGRYRITYVAKGARSVELAGDFDGWTPIELREIRSGLWQSELAMPPGTYHMNLRIDGGVWRPPPGSTVVEDDFGGRVGIVVVR